MSEKKGLCLILHMPTNMTRSFHQKTLHKQKEQENPPAKRLGEKKDLRWK